MNDAFCMVIMWVTGNVQNVHHYAINVKEVAGFEAVTDSMVFIDKKANNNKKTSRRSKLGKSAVKEDISKKQWGYFVTKYFSESVLHMLGSQVLDSKENQMWNILSYESVRLGGRIC